MIEQDFRIDPAHWSHAADREAARHVREQVYIIEQHIPEEEEWDELDADAFHVLARDGEGKPIGTGRLTRECRIGRMAVLEAWRGQGVGNAMLTALLEQARARGWTTIEAHAQTRALEFYRHRGFESVGEEFLECDIPHQAMRTQLAPLSSPPANRGTVHPPPAIENLGFQGPEATRAALIRLIDDARHALRIYSHDLDPGVLDHGEVIERLRSLATRGRNASVRILLHAPGAALADGHRLIDLAQRLDSIIQIRAPQERVDLDYASDFTLNDAGGYLFRTDATRMQGQGSTHAPGRHVQLAGYFKQVWERSLPASELRKLGL